MSLRSWLINVVFAKVISDPLKTLSMIVTLASAVTAVIPNPAASGALAIVHKVLDVIALNVGENVPASNVSMPSSAGDLQGVASNGMIH